MRRVGAIRMMAAVVPLTMLAPHAAWAQERVHEWGWSMHPMSGFWGIWGIAMMLMMFVFWGVVIAAIVLGMRWLARQGWESRSDPALETLRQRYARGEINKEQFETMKRDLS